MGPSSSRSTAALSRPWAPTSVSHTLLCLCRAPGSGTGTQTVLPAVLLPCDTEGQWELWKGLQQDRGSSRNGLGLNSLPASSAWNEELSQENIFRATDAGQGTGWDRTTFTSKGGGLEVGISLVPSLLGFRVLVTRPGGPFIQLLSSQSLNPGLRPWSSSPSLDGDRSWAVVQLMAAQTPPLLGPLFCLFSPLSCASL